jgi:hypothetical protein
MYNATSVKLSDPLEHGAEQWTRQANISAVEPVEPVKTALQRKLPGNRLIDTRHHQSKAISTE